MSAAAKPAWLRHSGTASSVDMLSVARAYLSRRWRVIPIPFKSKNPGRKRWAQERHTAGDLPRLFNGSPVNIGVLLGEPSNWLIDVDLDHRRCVELADQYLPHTHAVFGRPGKPRSHWLFQVTAPAATRKFISGSAGMLVELRSTGQQTVFPPSTHETGELIEWIDETAEPAMVDADALLDAVARLAGAVRVELGEKAGSRARRHLPVPPPAPAPAAAGPDSCNRIDAAVLAILRIRYVDHGDGSMRLLLAARRAVEHGLGDAQALAAIRKYAFVRPFPTAWTDEQILARVRDAESHCERGAAIQPDEAGLIQLGNLDPESGRIVLSPKRTLPTARAFVREFYDHPDGRTIHYYAGELLEWRGNRFAAVEDAAQSCDLQRWLHDALRYVVDSKTRIPLLAPFESNPATVKSALESIRTFAYLPATTGSPVWLDGDTERPSPTEIVACRTCLLHLRSMRRLVPTPLFFNVNALDFDYDPDATEPRQWQRFLGELFEEDRPSWDLLQEWFGYVLTGDTSQQKMLLIIGPRRSGKGTIARVLARLVGLGNVCGPTTSALAGPFGLQPLIGKSLALVSDARFSGENIQTVIERLLCISGEDTLTVDRKHTTSVTIKLPTRFVFLTNELPRLTDASGALSGRFMMLRLSNTFYGREDPSLSDRLLTELPGILNWAIAGWRRLRQRGHFVQPGSGAGALRDMEDLASPVAAFVRERCKLDADLRVDFDQLFDAWRRWCNACGLGEWTNKQLFGRDLAAACSSVKSRQGSGNKRFYQGIALRETR